MKRRLMEDLPMSQDLRDKLLFTGSTYANNPAMKKGVEDVFRLGSKRFKDVVKKLEEYTGIDDLSTREGMIALSQIVQDFRRIMIEIAQIESSHKKELEELSIYAAFTYLGLEVEFVEGKAVQKMFQIDAKLERPTIEGFKLKPDEEPEIDIKQDVKKNPTFDVNIPTTKETIEIEAHKRHIVNGLVQGSAILSQHEFLEIPEVAKILNKINKNLIKNYHLIIAFNDFQYFAEIKSIESASSKGNAIGGKVQGSQKADDEYKKEGIDTKIVARAVMFPILCQEIVKGVEDADSRYSHAKDADIATYVMGQTDTLPNEHLQILIGPEMVNRINEALPKNLNDKIVKMFFKRVLYSLEAKEFLEIIGLVISEDKSEIQKGKEFFAKMVKMAQKLKDNLYEYKESNDIEENDNSPDVIEEFLNDLNIELNNNYNDINDINNYLRKLGIEPVNLN